MLVHTGTRNFKCDFCSAAFRQIGHLLRHRKCVHRDSVAEDVFRCQTCNSGFKSWAKLSDHFRLHENGKEFLAEQQSYDCVYCSSKFSSERELQNHDLEEHLFANLDEI